MSVAPALQASSKQLHVMVVDDDEFQRELILELLRSLGIEQVLAATGGADAMLWLARAETKPHLIICDLHMPDVDGFDLLHNLVEQNFTGAVIIASGQSKTVIDYASLVAQISPYNYLGELEKPIEPSQLKLLIDKLEFANV